VAEMAPMPRKRLRRVICRMWTVFYQQPAVTAKAAQPLGLRGFREDFRLVRGLRKKPLRIALPLATIRGMNQVLIDYGGAARSPRILSR
jgi:hypothetical protein